MCVWFWVVCLLMCGIMWVLVCLEYDVVWFCELGFLVECVFLMGNIKLDVMILFLMEIEKVVL